MTTVSGVSVVICTHNGAARLPPTLAHLAAQRVPEGIAWEVLVVDNASTDGSAAAAQAAWPDDAPAPLRIVREPALGIAHARTRALDEALHEGVVFVDDDNWVAPDWVEAVSDVMTTRLTVGACGGDGEAVPECTPPAWFERFAPHWAVGRQGTEANEAIGHLWGAGLAVRRSAWRALRANGFAFALVGRSGSALLGGEDVELCCALQLAGWRLRYDPRLRFRHYLPRERLTWDYARRLLYGWGLSTVVLDAYLMAGRSQGLHGLLLRLWTWRLASVVIRLAWQAVRAAVRPGEGSAEVLRLATLRGRLRGLLRVRREWRAQARRVREARWRRAPG